MATATTHLPLEHSVRIAGTSVAIVEAQWKNDNSPLVWLSYTVDGKPQKKWLRLDLDKQVVIDEIGDPRLDRAIHDSRRAIWQGVMEERRRRFPQTLIGSPV